jgi:tripartite-type tricarboxylate transporter receptor subunit TctC
MRFMRSTLSLLLATLCAAGAQAQPGGAGGAYPSRPVTVVVAYPPGGSSDVIGRVIAQALGKELNQTFVVENRAGFGGNVGAKAVAAAPKDGYTLLMGAVTAHSISQTLAPEKAGYNLEHDFTPISMLGKAPLTLVVSKEVPANTLAEFVALAKKDPGRITYASAGIGTTQHLGGELFQQLTKVKLVHVPYKGSGPAMTDLIGGQVLATFETGPAIVPFLKGGKMKTLAYANETRSAVMPDVPTTQEAGLNNFTVAGTYGLLAPAGTPMDVVNKLNAAVKTALQTPEVKATFEKQGLEPTYTTTAQTRTQITREIAKWKSVIEAGGVKAE